MRKRIIGFAMLLTLLFGTMNAIAADKTTGFSFKVGSNSITVNGKIVKAEKPYIKNKATMVPLTIVVNAFAADMKYDAKKSVVTLDYNGIIVKFTLNNKTAYVNGKKATLLCAPEMKANTKIIMVPLEFICDSYGADITKDKKTALITVTKEISGENSIKDFGLILKKTTKSKIGDSYYKWSINHPKDLKIAYREFSGDYMKFGSVDKSYDLYISINKQKDETIDSIMASELNDVKDYTLIFQNKDSKAGMTYVRTVYQDSEENTINENRAYINNGFIYYVGLVVYSPDDYKKSAKYNALLDSFDTNYAKNDLVEDISDVDKDNLRTYESKNLKWSTKIPANFIKSSDDQKLNSVFFYDQNDDMTSIMINMYSIEKGLTLDSWVDHDTKILNDYYDPNLMQIIKIEDGTNKTTKFKMYYTKIKMRDKEYVTCDKYILGKNYRYSTSYIIPIDIYNDKTEKAKFDNIVESFQFTEPNADVIGQLTDADMLPEITGVRTISDKVNKWSFEIPVSWTAVKSTGASNYAQYSSSDSRFNFGISAIKDKTVEELKKYYEDTLLKQAEATGQFKNESRETLTEKGTTVYKYVNRLKTGKIDTLEFHYIIGKNNIVYDISFAVGDLFYGPKSKEIFKAIWDSIKLD